MKYRGSYSIIASVAIFFGTMPEADAQVIKADFTQMCDSVSARIKEHTTIRIDVKLKSVKARSEAIDFNFTANLGELPWREGDHRWLHKTIADYMPEKYASRKVGNITINGEDFNEFILPPIHNDGKPHVGKYKVKDPRGTVPPLVMAKDAYNFHKGLSGRTIALWQSHGRYFDAGMQRWSWQRSPNFMTTEDMFTQSFVLQYLIPMLENAGATVLDPRERDTNKWEAVVDNDEAFPEAREGLIRRKGKYTETGKWIDAGEGFADKKAVYMEGDNPFRMGSARRALCSNSKSRKAEAIWRPDIPERGSYAVYISYKTDILSTSEAHYTVHDAAGDHEFYVNQQIGGGTWIYLGTFDFNEGNEGYVKLDNTLPHAQTGESKKQIYVSADGVRFGGGMGKVARGPKNAPDSLWCTSGLPSYMEGAYYNMQWGGAGEELLEMYDDDYTSDFATRGAWVSDMSGGSHTNPNEEGKKIPVDISLAFHTDAGVTPDDSIVGTLGIWTHKWDGKTKFDTGEDRRTAREYLDLVQTQVVDDIRAGFDPEWTRRQIWNRSYSESRTTTVPGALLELLSHQNFADMKFGHDPAFKFTVARAVYKGMLKYLSTRYGCSYAVTPLPVTELGASFIGDWKAAVNETEIPVRLTWKAPVDSLEPTAVPTGYFLRTRIDDGAFGKPEPIEFDKDGNGWLTAETRILRGHVYSYIIEAFNDGGKSWPSETISAGVPEHPDTTQSILVVNNFDRVSGPVWFDTPDYAGFDTRTDMGVPYIRDITFIGDMYQFRRNDGWKSNANAGFGASYSNYAGVQLAGNTFDYISVHGKSILDAGYPFISASHKAFEDNPEFSAGATSADIICGKQVTVPTGVGRRPARFRVFPEGMQERLKAFTSEGKNVLISGAHIGTDVWDSVYCAIHTDSLQAVRTQEFAKEVLGYKWTANYATFTGEVRGQKSKGPLFEGHSFGITTRPNEKTYCAEAPDGLAPSDKKGGVFLKYADTGTASGIWSQRAGYKTVAIGFPIELITDRKEREELLKSIIEYFNSHDK